MNRTFRSLRLIASFALLGTVTMGVLTGWIDHPPVDFRALGAGVGAVAGVIFKSMHVI